MVVQIARLRGCRVIGIAGGPEKCQALIDDYGVDGTIDYKNEVIAEKLRSLAPRGVDIYFDNVGGTIMQDVVDQMAKFGRVVLCGTISSYDSENPAPGPRNMLRLVVYSVKMQGFLLPDFWDDRDVAIADLRKWKESGQLTHKTDVRVGFKSLPETFLALFSGEKEGTLLLRVEDQGAHFAQRQAIVAPVERDPAHVLHQREVLVVDGDRDRLLVGEGAGLFVHGGVGGGEAEQRGRDGGLEAGAFHGRSPFCWVDLPLNASQRKTG
jgi:hypothetical protein